MIARRAMLAGLPAAGMALALPAAALAAAEHPWEKARRLAFDLAETLSQVDGGQWLAIIEPATTKNPVLFGDRENFHSMHRITEAQQAAIDTWRAAQHAANAQWDVYASFSQNSPAQKSAYAEWRRLHEIGQDAHSDLMMVLWRA